jgi:hypothetical protein
VKRLKPGVAIRALALALIVAVLGTVMHQTNLNGLPFGSGLALLIVSTVAINLRKNRASGWIFFGGLAVLIFLIGMDIHDDKMIPANFNGYLWSYGSVTIAAFVAMFPKFRNR